jgi:hypothetical protein
MEEEIIMHNIFSIPDFWHGGCTGCKYLVKVVGHPWNNPSEFTHGRITDMKCFGCKVDEDSETVVLFDHTGVGCELYEVKKSAD